MSRMGGNGELRDVHAACPRLALIHTFRPSPGGPELKGIPHARGRASGAFRNGHGICCWCARSLLDGGTGVLLVQQFFVAVWLCACADHFEVLVRILSCSASTRSTGSDCLVRVTVCVQQEKNSARVVILRAAVRLATT